MEIFKSKAEALAKQIANGPTLAFGSIKRLLQTTYGNGLETQMELETRNIAKNLNAQDGQNGDRQSQRVSDANRQVWNPSLRQNS